MYKREWYNTVLNAIIEHYDLNAKNIPEWQYAAWRSSIKRFFDSGYLIREIVGAIDEAGNKKQWPGGRYLFTRLEDVILKNRRERTPIVKLTGLSSPMSSLKDLLKK